MENRWSDGDAEAAIERWSKAGANLDLALRVYSSRLIGAEPRLVVHGGGNTSVKTSMPDELGENIDVICIKGSGWDLATIEPQGLPAVRLQPLRRLVALDAMTDEAMVNVQRANLLDTASPNPSVETLLHAFLPHPYIDHSHANAILSLTDQDDGEALCREVFGETMAIIPYIMPGFRLAKAASAVFERKPDVLGMILVKHGIVTFGRTARESYDRMISAVTLAEQRIAAAARKSVAGMQLPRAIGRLRPKSFAPIRLPERIAAVADVAPIVRGLAAIDNGEGAYRRWICAFRSSPAILDFVNGADLGRYSQQGPATPDHVIRIKPKPMLTPPADGDRLDAFTAGTRAAIEAYRAEYVQYFARHNARHGGVKTALDATPRIVLVPGLGLFGLGASRREAAIAADLAETNIDVITAAETLGRYRVIGEEDLFDFEYWSLEQAKLGKTAEKPLSRRITVITGGAGGIGAATAAAFRAAGSEVAILDIDAERAEATAAAVGGIGVGCDVTRPEAVARAMATAVASFGGIDIVVSNAGGAIQGRIGEVTDTVLRESFELNFWSHQTVARTAVQIMRAQGTGGCLLFNASKQAFNPGPDFGPYGLPKAALIALMRQYAIDYGGDGIRAAAVNADRVRTGLFTNDLIAERAAARGVSPASYLSANLLGREVRCADVADAFVALACATRTTAAVLTVDGGNIAAAPR